MDFLALLAFVVLALTGGVLKAFALATFAAAAAIGLLLWMSGAGAVVWLAVALVSCLPVLAWQDRWRATSGNRRD